MELPSNISYTIARASESQFIHIIRNQLSKYKIWASIFDCSRGIERRSLSSLRTESLLASPVASQASSPEISCESWNGCNGKEEGGKFANSHPLKQNIVNHSTSKVVTDGAARKADKVCRAIVSRSGPPVFI